MNLSTQEAGNQVTATKETTAADVLGAPVSSANPPAIAGASKTQAEPENEKIASKLQLLTQRERAAVERIREAKALETSAQARAKELEQRETKLKEFESLKQTNPMKALELLGLSYQDLTQIALADGQMPPELQVKRLEEKLNSSLKAQEDEKRLSAERAQQEEAKRAKVTVDRFKGEIQNYIKENSNRYELIGFENQQELVYEVIDEHFNRTYKAAIEKAAALEEDPNRSLQDALRLAEEAGADLNGVTGEVWSIAQGADKVEEALEKKYDKARSLNKVKVLLSPRPVKADPKQLIPEVNRQQPKTLNNQLSATPSVPRKTPVTDDERIARAIAYAKGIRP